MSNRFFTLFLVLVCLSSQLYGQRTILRGNVIDAGDGNGVIGATVTLQGTKMVTVTDDNGFFNLTDAPEGSQKLIITFIGFDTLVSEVKVKSGSITYQKLYLKESSSLLGEVNIQAANLEKRTEVKAGEISVTPREIKALPSIGGEADLAQYLPVLPGIVSTGDQGGQIYIRGGAPVQNKILLDGMTIFNPFHSIGLFSVFETEAIRSIDVISAGFNAEYGGRVSAVIDIKSKDGNKKEISGVVGVNPFAAKAVLEGPIVKAREDSPFSASYIFSAKKSLLEYTSKSLYSYVNKNGLPFAFNDYYGKVNLALSNGSKIDFFGFNFTDQVDYTTSTNFRWNNYGGGTNFIIYPQGSNLSLGGTFNISHYDINLKENTFDPRTSAMNNFQVGMNLTSFGAHSETNFGIDLQGFNTKLEYTNFLKYTIEKADNTTEIAGYVKHKMVFGKLILQPGLRLHFYPAIREFSPEPRIGLKYNINDNIRFKAAAGMYSQNLFSTIDDRDVVNLFNGFVSGPEEKVFDYKTNSQPEHVLQKAQHLLVGLEVDINKNLELNLEPYYKHFAPLININRSKASANEANYLVERGEAYGVDLTGKYTRDRLYVWATYSYAKVTRDDGKQIYPTIYDRTHNINFLASYVFGRKRDFEVSVRWNYGTGFPFTRAIGFYDQIPKINLETDFATSNGQLGVIYESKRNAGRLTDYHRLDFSAKKTFNFSAKTRLEVAASITNAYDRDNLFYFNRLTYERVNQLPILPSLGVNFYF